VTELGQGLDVFQKLQLIQLFALHVAKDAIEICLVLRDSRRRGILSDNSKRICGEEIPTMKLRVVIVCVGCLA